MALIADARVVPLRFVLGETVDTSRERIRFREGALLRLRSDEGLEGFGEATPVPGFPGADARETRRILVKHAEQSIGSAPDALPRLSLPTAPAAAFAIETAVCDLLARRAKKSLAEWLAGGPCRRVLPVNALARTHDEAVAAIRSGYGVVKLKVGVAPLDDELERIASLVEALPNTARIRLDANQAWSFADATRALSRLAEIGIESIEEPLADPTPETLAQLRKESGVVIAADESAVLRSDFDALLAAQAVDRVVLKAGAIGGLAEARDRAARCAAAGVEVVVTTGLEGAIGRVAAVHLAASLPPTDLAHGLATDALFIRDLCDAAHPVAGALAVPAAGGLGVRPDADALVELAR